MRNNDLGKDDIKSLVPRIALPSMLAQFISVMYSIVDRMFVGNIPKNGTLSLAGVGICGPVLTMIGAFSFLIGIGGTPLVGIALGEKNEKKASKILANCFLMFIFTSVAITLIVLSIKEPMLRLFGASDNTYPYAEKYFSIYVKGTIFALLSVGMGQFIIAQGYAREGMLSVALGAVVNIILDPVFIFVFHMGVEGAAVATVISQCVSATFVLYFLFKKSRVKISFRGYSIKTMLKVLTLGLSPFSIIAFDNLMIISLNALLLKYGGSSADRLITVNTILQSFMLVMTMPLGGISGGTQCILSYNYGAGNSKRVIRAQKYIFGFCIGFTALMFIASRVFGHFFVSLFTSDLLLNKEVCRAINIYMITAIPLGIQYEIVDGFTGMGQVKIALPLSMWRKSVYFVSIFILPLVSGAENIFYAEPISDILAVALSIPLYFIMTKKILQKREIQIKEKNNLQSEVKIIANQ